MKKRNNINIKENSIPKHDSKNYNVLSSLKEIRHIKEKMKSLNDEIYYSKELSKSTNAKLKNQNQLIEKMGEFIEDLQETIEIKKDQGDVYRPKGEKIEIALLKKEIFDLENQVFDIERVVINREEDHLVKIKETNKLINTIEDELIFIFNKIQDFEVTSGMTVAYPNNPVPSNLASPSSRLLTWDNDKEKGLSMIDVNVEKVIFSIQERLGNIDKINTENLNEIKNNFQRKNTITTVDKTIVRKATLNRKNSIYKKNTMFNESPLNLNASLSSLAYNTNGTPKNDTPKGYRPSAFQQQNSNRNVLNLPMSTKNVNLSFNQNTHNSSTKNISVNSSGGSSRNVLNLKESPYRNAYQLSKESPSSKNILSLQNASSSKNVLNFSNIPNSKSMLNIQSIKQSSFPKHQAMLAVQQTPQFIPQSPKYPMSISITNNIPQSPKFPNINQNISYMNLSIENLSTLSNITSSPKFQNINSQHFSPAIRNFKKQNTILDNMSIVNNIDKIHKMKLAEVYLSENKRKPFKPLLFDK